MRPADLLLVPAVVLIGFGALWDPDTATSAPEPTVGAVYASIGVLPPAPAVRLTPPTASSVTTTATMVAARWHHWNPDVDRWYDTAVEAGWPDQDWSRLACIINRESRGDPTAYNGRGRDDSYGLLQLNMRAHRSWVGPLVDWDFNRLFDPATNLSVGRVLFDRAVDYYGNGWQPWNASDGSCR